MDLKKLIRQCVIEQLSEISTSAGAGPYMTKYAFRGTSKAGKKKAKEIATQSGFSLTEGRSKYLDFKEDTNLTPIQKIGVNIREINKQLDEINTLVSMVSRLKEEENLSADSLWKRTNKALTQMENKMLRVANRLRDLKS